MKKFFTFTACLLAAFACAKVETELVSVTAEPGIVEYVSIPITSEEPDTKAYYYEDSSFWTYLWEDEDTFNYFYYTGGHYQSRAVRQIPRGPRPFYRQPGSHEQLLFYY